MHVSLFLLTPGSFALLASSCCRVWCQLLALVGLNSSIEAGRARPLVRLAALERISDHLGLLQARGFIVVGQVAKAAREKVAAHAAQGWTLHIDTFETFSLNSAFQRLGYA